MRQVFVDPVSNRTCELVLPVGGTGFAGVRHPACPALADLAIDLDAFFCTACKMNGRISGAWARDVIAASRRGLDTPHQPAEACWAVHCSFHNLDEPVERAYRICVECGHAYATAEELRAAFAAEVLPDLSTLHDAPPAEEILACPYCVHDW